MRPEFSRSEQLLGAAAMKKLAASSVAVFGVGGVGSHCIEALARGGVGRLILVDHDTVSISNINRQSIAYHSTVGQSKTKVMKDRILDINPNALVSTFETFVLPENLEELFSQFPERPDYVVDAIDTVSAKLALAVYTRDHGILALAAMGTGNKLHPELFEIADIEKTSVCPLCRVMRRELKKRGVSHLKVLYSKEEPLKPLPAPEGDSLMSRRAVPGSVSFVPPAAGLMMAGEVIRELTGK